ncbi:MAG: PAS domain S-box protein [Synergistales bacterium]
MRRKTLRMAASVLIVILFQPLPSRCAEAAERVRVAVYDNPPIIFLDEQGRMQGLFADVLDAVAAQADWQVEPVSGTFSQGLERLGSGTVDLMAGVAFTPEREKLYSFNRETVLSNYGIFFQPEGRKFDSLLDLDGRRVAVVREDIYARGFASLAVRFGIAYEAVEVDDYPDVFRAIESGRAEAGLVSRSYAQANQARFRVNRTPIVISPVELRFAAPLGRSSVLLQVIDFHLGQMKTREDSQWLRSMSKWIEGGSGAGRLPRWAYTAGWIIGFLLVVFLAAAVLFRKQAALRTRQLLKSRRALHVHKDYLENLFQSSPEAIAFLDENGMVARVNRPFTELFGYSQEECQGRHLDDFLVPPERAEEARLATERGRSGLLNLFETVRVAKDGTRIDVQAQGNPIYNSEGGKIGEFFLYRDIRDRKAVETALEKEKTFLEQLYDNAPEGIIVTDLNGRIRRANRAFVQLFGYGRDELLNRDVDDLIVPGESKVEAADFTLRADRGERVSFEGVRRRKDGTLLDVSFLGVPIVSEAGQLGVYAIYRDITARKAAERALLANREDLRRSLQRMDRAWRQTVEVLSSTAEARDPYTAGHQRNVAHLAGAVAREMGQGERFVEGVVLAALVHDIGKIVVPAEILSKPGRLTPLEFDLIRVHPEAGSSILRSIDLPWPLAEIVRQHHERLDGSGYPNGLSGGDILKEARVIAVADVVEAMASHRPYRPALGVDRALEEISSGRGRLYDEQVVDACLALFREREFSFRDLEEDGKTWSVRM